MVGRSRAAMQGAGACVEFAVRGVVYFGGGENCAIVLAQVPVRAADDEHAAVGQAAGRVAEAVAAHRAGSTI